ncbi:uncharacterized protein HMPREF1541_06276 [Cyphellophora europaea CBS 101466]|uniref:Transcription factor domain-containing protein n=1 Tax=Cyphellophora europaea (strain CBS 101466) TaxID=1220924 RepID=W2RPJ3_CYPE1|nr:uncharacterized protein HMPREF1541_06276 [Cyphellophora europaea CBS 101466]ETN38245.1 hypothetical protein HMPREF1541_06276 [Cyphellophora europaea CBS 101466]
MERRCVRALDTTGLDRPGKSALREVLRLCPMYPTSAIVALEALEALNEQNAIKRPSQSASVDSLYGESVHLLSKEISSNSSSPMSLYITALLLLAIELLQRRRQNGLKHGIAAVQSLSTSTNQQPGSRSIGHLGRIYDLQCMLYSEGVRLPTLEAADPPVFSIHEEVDWRQVECRSIEALHYAQACIARVYHDSIAADTGMHESAISGCTQRLVKWRECLQRQLTVIKDASSRSILLILQNLFILTLLQVKCLFVTYEMQWDAHRDDYDAIVQSADEFFAACATASDDNCSSFTLQVGVIPPLHMVALKCRHLDLRKRAIAHLESAGCEGPFIGPQLAAMARSCMELERQMTSDGVASTDASANQLSSKLPEEHLRVANCTLLEHNGEANGSNRSSPFTGWTTVRFLRRRKPGTVTRARVLTSTSFRSAPDLGQLQGEELDPEMWEEWTEKILFGKEVDRKDQLSRTAKLAGIATSKTPTPRNEQ